MAQTSPFPSPRTPLSSPFPLPNKSSKNPDSKTTLTTMSQAPRLQSSKVFQKLVLGSTNIPLRKILRVKKEQINVFEETKEQLEERVIDIEKEIEEKKKDMVGKCKDLRRMLKENQF